VTVGAALLIYVLVLGTVGRAVFARARWPAQAPRLGAAVLLAGGWSVLLALVLAGLTVALPATALSGDLSQLLGACVLRVRAAYATPGGAAVAGAGIALSAATLLRAGWAAGRVSRDRRVEQRRQRLLITLAGRQLPGVPAVVVDHPAATAYCLAGHDHAVVITTGALELLTDAQLGAVLAHERAHLAAHHHRRLTAAAVASQALPALPLLRDLPASVRRLLEMHADEAAAREHDPEALASALVAVASGAPAAALALAGGDKAARIRRLLLPPQALTPCRRALARAATAALILAPILLASAPAAVAVNQPPLRPTQGTAHIADSHPQLTTAAPTPPPR
jgi:Zn-dependent protease with chaperone function